MHRLLTVVAAVGLAAAAPTALAAKPGEVLLIPWGEGNPPVAGSGSIGMFSPIDGRYLGDLISGEGDRIIFPNTAILGPDRLVYISDQVNWAVYRYDLDGNFVDKFLGEEDGVINPRGMVFDGTNLIVSTHPHDGIHLHAVRRYGLDGTRKGDVMPAGLGISTWDILLEDDGRFLLSHLGESNNGSVISFYPEDLPTIGTLYTAPFPTQLTPAHTRENCYGLSFSGRVTEFNDGGVVRSFTLSGLSNAGQGVFALENGQILGVSFNAGVFTYSASGVRLSTVRAGFGLYGMAKLVDLCRADMNGDGSFNFFDLVIFLEAFNEHRVEADFRAPFGEFGFADLDGFLDEFLMGCPYAEL